MLWCKVRDSTIGARLWELEMELSCECGNETEFTEKTTVEFIVDAECNRGEKVFEQTDYFCMVCGKSAEICDEGG